MRVWHAGDDDSPPQPNMVRLSVWGFRCLRCLWTWLPRACEPPLVCPKCKSPYWDTPRGSHGGRKARHNLRSAYVEDTS